MPTVTVEKPSATTVRAIVVLDESEWKMFSTICFRGGQKDVCSDSINGFVLALVRKSYKKSISEIVKESTGCSRLTGGIRESIKASKKVIFTFKCA